ncbi:hypothetical protein [Embleya sp. NBC_00896]|uniref:hypothetical protein n=1 Tax=Embleya sp. NBC_00896 TaxID=2975961 RepID=UPI00386718DA|nr:hypothetical protein OG928_32075 [Embleya sp. NBC_00896]
MAELTDEEFERCERELPGALRAVGDTFRGPSPDLVGRGLARGRQRSRIRAVRRAAIAGVLVAASVGGWAVFGDGSEASVSGPVARTDVSTQPGGQRDLLPYLAKAVPPEGNLTNDESRFDDGVPRVLRSQASISATYSNGSGSSPLIVTVSRPVPGTGTDLASDAYCPAARALLQCTRSAEPDGAALTVRKARKEEGSSEQEWRVLYTRPDAARVDVRTIVAEPGPGSAGGALVLSIEQITAIARSAVWDPVVAAQPAADQQVLGLLRALTPPEVRVVGVDGDADVGVAVVETDAGRFLLSASVTSASTDGRSDCPGKGNGTCEMVTLSDGTRARVEHDRNTQGRIVPLALTAFRAHGPQVRLEAGAPPPKGFSVPGELRGSGSGLTADQLMAIAASPRWDAP